MILDENSGIQWDLLFQRAVGSVSLGEVTTSRKGLIMRAGVVEREELRGKNTIMFPRPICWVLTGVRSAKQKTSDKFLICLFLLEDKWKQQGELLL